MTAEVVPIPPNAAARTASYISQATAVEQARAIAEVQAAIIVAQQNPRDMDRALGDMRDSCGRVALANRAFYAVPNRGTGPSVHLARELARIWGNLSYGVHELSQDIEHGTSEVQAFCVDLQTNTRSTRTFIVQHARMKGKQQVKLTDLGDIYLGNQNVGARAVRECIFSVLPSWLTEEAQDRCHATLEKGEGKPLEQRISEAVAAFDKLGVTVQQLESKIGRKRGAWTASDVAQLVITYTSITRDGLDKDEVFPTRQVTAQEILGAAKPQPADQPPAEPDPLAGMEPQDMMRDGQRRKMFALFNDAGLNHDRDKRLALVSDILGTEVASTRELSAEQADRVIAYLSDGPE